MIGLFGTINPPPGVKQWAGGGSGTAGLVPFLSALIKFVIVIGGLYTLLNLVMAGYSFMGAGDDPKKIQAAWAKIWQSLLGLLVMAGAFVLAAIFGWLIFKNPLFILKPQIYTP